MICEDRRGGLLIGGGAEMIRGREKFRQFWVASPEIEFRHVREKCFEANYSPKTCCSVKRIGESDRYSPSRTYCREIFLQASHEAGRRRLHE